MLPGLIETPLVTAMAKRAEPGISADGLARLLAARHSVSPTGRMEQPEDVARTVAFLLSDRAAYISGQQIVVDAGLGMRAAL